MRDIAYDLVANVANTKYSDLPAQAVEETKKFILDTIGCAIAGSSAPGCLPAVEVYKDWAGKQESTVLVYGGKITAPNAAFVNSMMVQALDIDDVHEAGGGHFNVGALPAALAMAERKGNVSGKELITAVAVGVDVACRVSMGIIGPLAWLITCIGSYFGASAAAAKMLGLDEAKTHHALGIVYSQCAGAGQCLADRAIIKRAQAAFGAQAGVVSAVLASKGITGARDIFEGQWGLYPLYFQSSYDRNKVLNGLGKVYEGQNMSMKFYVGGYYTHPCNWVTQTLMKEHGFKAEDVEEVVAHVTEVSHRMVGRPFTIGDNPQVDAQFSIPYGIALALCGKDVFIADFDEARIRSDMRALETAKKVKVIGDTGSIKDVGRRTVPVEIVFKLKNGKTYSMRATTCPGSPEMRATNDQAAEKFRKCAAFAQKPLPKGRVEEMIKTIYDLENVADASDLLKMTVA